MFVRAALASFSLMALLPETKADELAIEVAGGFGTGTGSATSGWAFHTNQILYVTALDVRANPTYPSHRVSLYDGSQNLLAQTIVSSADPTVGSSLSFWSHDITPVTLLANTTYYIAESPAGNSVNNAIYSGTLTVNPAITYLGNVYSASNNALPTASVGGFPQGFFGANFEFSTTPVPEPMSVSMIGIGAVSLLGRRSRAKGGR